ncbi:thiosulfate sulfurtransferase GlpE [Halarchaeum acidiphilum MH1-52-1]|uniref:Thiosulfate sulfurtransferase GlpE n=1 Tax=Halarchaeum acidiphilum MH1-52-1 TaxID=1261545 RepID=U2YVX8_9EURY|nr:rhodanese-like domain-containing protein [Halarchaeum acidiphilum]GAD53185.1 thiosulfate sulfurtransferase GlpE [Halarchaeum acidiphilum MH1-52-1]
MTADEIAARGTDRPTPLERLVSPMPDELSPEEVEERLVDDGFALVDIRDPDSYAAGHVPGAENLTTRELQSVVEDRDWGESVAFVCYLGKSSKEAAAFVEQYGDAGETYSVAGGMDAWDGPVESEE